MAEHILRLSVPTVTIAYKDAELEILSDGLLLGTLKMSRGSLDWHPVGMGRF